MDERIKELAHQAELIIKKSNGDEFRYGAMDPKLEKFAELIVKECGYCADIFELLGCPVDMDPTETKPSDYIKKHFGVEA